MKSKLNTLEIALLLIGALVFSYSVRAQKSVDSVVFYFKTGPQFFEVPAGITKLHIDAYGAQGGGPKGGKGGRVQSDMQVSPGAKLIIYIGEQPAGSEGGQNGGGKGCGKGTGGGGASDIRVGGTSLSSRVLVAGGGGGYGYGGYGGGGGGLTGAEGGYDGTPYHMAKGGTQTEGGAGARAYFSKGGQLGLGGEGINSNGQCTNGAMAGGGGGYYGGGGGGAGAGGGGSSYTDSSIFSNVSHEQGVREGSGKIVITWTK